MTGRVSLIARACLRAVVGIALASFALTAQAGPTSYTYDALGRVTAVSFSDGSQTTYSYDAAGNRTQMTVCAPPVAAADTFQTAPNTQLAADPRANDTGCSLTVTSVTQGAHGAVAIQSGGVGITYTPTSGYAGSDTFTYTITDNVSRTSTGNVSMTVSSATPVANPVSAAVTYNSSNDPITLNITGATASSVAVSSQASHGVATASGMTITYTPATGYSGSDSFQYTATNSGGTSLPATASITVGNVPNGTVLFNQSVAGSFSYTVPAGVTYVNIEGWGAGSNVKSTYIKSIDATAYVGGSGGGYFLKHIAVTQGQVISGTVGAGGRPGGSTQVTTPALTAYGGSSSGGGTATGGDTNISGTSGTSTVGGGAGNGGGNQTAVDGNGTTPGGGGAPEGGSGTAGEIKITAVTS